MKINEIEDRCEKLRSLVELGPGENQFAKRQVVNILEYWLSDEKQSSYVKEKALEAKENFDQWFRPRKWNKAGDGGLQLRQFLLADIAKLHSASMTVAEDKLEQN